MIMLCGKFYRSILLYDCVYGRYFHSHRSNTVYSSVNQSYDSKSNYNSVLRKSTSTSLSFPDLTNRGTKHFYKKSKMSRERGNNRGWIDLDKYNVFARSISGLETSVVVENENLSIAFDMGYAAKDSVKCKHVFISHGHMDHISGIPQHVSKRSLYGMPNAKYYVPSHLINDIKSVCSLYSRISEKTSALNETTIIPCDIGDSVQISSKYTVNVFPTVHRVKSQGYILYQHRKKLKPQYLHLDGKSIGEKLKSGEVIHDVITTPDVAFTGDTTFDIFRKVYNPDLLRVKILIAEATYIDQDGRKNMVELAQGRGHTHLQEFIDNEYLFKHIQHIVLIHFSDKYSPGYIKNTVYSSLPDSLKDKVIVSTYAKEIY